MVLAQLTQPLRRAGLLADVAALARLHGSAVTACEGRQDDWRTCSQEGCWSRDKGDRALLLDGALYAWRPGKLEYIFMPSLPHGVAINYVGQPVDVDFPGDVPGAFPGAWAELLLRNYLCQG